MSKSGQRRFSNCFGIFIAFFHGSLIFADDESIRPRTNVLCIADDDLGPDPGCCGADAIIGPMIDQFASTAVGSDRVYCQFTVRDAVTVPGSFKNSGVYLASFGNVAHTPWRGNQPWSESNHGAENESLWSDDAKETLATLREGLQALGRPETVVNRHRAATEVVGISNHQHRVSATAQQAASAIWRLSAQGQPFFLTIRLVGHYLPLVVTQRDRPQITFRNQRNHSLTLYWIDSDGSERQQGVIKPGKELTQNTTFGHKFVARGAMFESKSIVSETRRQTVVFHQPAKPVKNLSSTTLVRPVRPNVVVCMADDWSWPHAGVLGDPVVKTPNFDWVANEGVSFRNAFVSTPSCTPSRLSILTGQHHWRLQEGDSLGGSLREDFSVYTEMLQKAGYAIGRFGKGVWPSEHTFRKRDSFGERFRSFDKFLESRQIDQPFCYWHGGQDPHRPYELGVGERSEMDLSKIVVPKCLPDNDTVRGDLADYLWEVQRFDSEVGVIIKRLRAIGQLENTILVISGDNGMPFPRCKATLYDQGTRVPLAIRWGKNVTRGRIFEDFVSLCDLAPTFLEAAGLDVPDEMTGKSLIPLLHSEAKGSDVGEESVAVIVEQDRSFVVSGVERHVYSYPKRAIRTADYLYIRNYSPDTWPTGEIDGEVPQYDFAQTPWPTGRGAFSYAIDPSPSKQFLRLHRDEDGVKKLADLSFAKRPEEELYDLSIDPHQLNNIARDRQYATSRRRMRQMLDAELIRSNDPRARVVGYRSSSVEGWPVRISEALLEDLPDKTARAIELLHDQLKTVKRLVPKAAVDRLVDVPIWLSPKYEGVRPTGEYHPGLGWLKGQGRRPELHRCIEFTNVERFEREVARMPVLVLHELAHAYHDQVLGFGHDDVKATYEIARNSGSYDAVQRGNSKRKERAYAITNEREYFAETTEAYFDRNDFYPFDRKELAQHDPRMEELLKRLWLDDKKR